MGTHPATDTSPDKRQNQSLSEHRQETESNICRDENDELQTVTTPVYIADEIDIDAPLTYDRVVEALIRDRYSVSDELAILRQQSSKPEEFEAYNEYAETCKTWARSINY